MRELPEPYCPHKLIGLTSAHASSDALNIHAQIFASGVAIAVDRSLGGLKSLHDTLAVSLRRHWPDL